MLVKLVKARSMTMKLVMKWVVWISMKGYSTSLEMIIVILLASWFELKILRPLYHLHHHQDHPLLYHLYHHHVCFEEAMVKIWNSHLIISLGYYIICHMQLRNTIFVAANIGYNNLHHLWLLRFHQIIVHVNFVLNSWPESNLWSSLTYEAQANFEEEFFVEVCGWTCPEM